jgi:uncharacterized membrane protein
MERMLVVVFDSETKAYEGSAALHQLEQEGNLSIYAGAVVAKNADGTTAIRQAEDFGPFGTLLGTSVGSLIGLIGGPVGVAVGAISGLTLGGLVDLDNVGVGEDFIAEVAASLSPNKVAVVAEVEEAWTTPVDTRMEALGGQVFRRALWEVEDAIRDKDIAAMKADLAQMKTEMAEAHADRRAKLQTKAGELQAKLDAKLKAGKERRAALAQRQSSKREVLKKNAATAGRALKELANTPV